MGNKIVLGVVLGMFSAIMYPQTAFCVKIVMSPEMTIKIYFDAYAAQDWEVVTEYMHPELLQRLKRRIVEMVEAVSPRTRNIFLREYQAQSLEALRQKPARQLFILYLMNRWKDLDAQTELGMGNAQLDFIKTTFIHPEECLVEFKSSVNLDSGAYNKIQVFHLKKYDEKWRIYSTDGLKNLDKELSDELNRL